MPPARMSVAARRRLLWTLAALLAAGAAATDGSCVGNKCEEDICPPDSKLTPNNGNATCVCALEWCVQPSCSGQAAVLLHKATGNPGECCDVFECHGHNSTTNGCAWNNGHKQNGTTWLKDDCTICKCEDGIIVCAEKESCQEISSSCLEKTTPVGECCPVCLSDSAGCVVDAQGVLIKNGQKWQEDPCTTCMCIDGKKQCRSFTCETKCKNPKHIENECCPICEDDESFQVFPNCSIHNCSLECPDGFVKDDKECYLCLCHTAAHGEQDENIENEDGEDDIDDDVYPVDDGFGDIVCKTVYGEYYGDGATWFDGCRQCYCHGGSEMCNLITCPAVRCDNPIFNPAVDCCPHCPDGGSQSPEEQPTTGCFSVDGAYHIEGEMWSLNKCTKCLCHSGQVMCKAEECPPIPCLNPVYQDGLCCPVCPNFTLPSFKGTAPCVSQGRLHGETWREQNCNSCVCSSGKTECFTERCPETQCGKLILVKNQCCPMCLESDLPKVCAVGNLTYVSGDKWAEAGCTLCECRNGIKTCSKQTCSEECLNSAIIPVECCTKCLDPVSGKTHPETSLFDERTYSIIIGLLFLLVAIMGFYMMWQCYRKKQFKLGNLKTCPSAAYNNYMHRDSYAPPRYTAGDRQSKCEPCHYKCIPSYDTTQFNDYIKSPSFVTTEKTALAPV